MKKVKQVIVMRKDLGMRKGKMIAQGAHASMAFMSKRNREAFGTGKEPKFTADEKEWMEGSFAKVCVYVTSEEELLNIFHQAKNDGLTVELITDSGLTEFHGIPTNTCVGIGPHRADKIDAVTGDLKLL